MLVLWPLELVEFMAERLKMVTHQKIAMARIKMMEMILVGVSFFMEL